MITIKSEREIQLMRKTCSLAARTLDYIAPFIKPGISTLKLNDLCHAYILEHNAIPAPLNYHGFPKSICTSLNQVVCHGIPSAKDILKDGDILNVDVTTILDGYHGDTNRTFYVGDVSPTIKKLVEVTHQCLMEGILEVRGGARLGNIGARIAEIAHENGYSVVEDYCGHGIGREFHEDPQVVHIAKRDTGVELKPGMTFTIEPMINMGRKETKLLKDNWTVLTRDGSISAQFEHTVLVTEGGFEILTL